MVADGLLTRQRYREVPPRVDYELTERARDVLPVVGALAEWGYAWTWGPPRPGEAVDIGAILRAATGLALGDRMRNGSADLVVKGRDEDQHYTVRSSGGSLTLEERAESDADARITGDERAWIEAFSPTGSRAGLQIEGDRRMADAILDACGAPASAARASNVA
jgi:hypothetical protein